MDIGCNCEKVLYETITEARAAATGIWDEDKVKLTPYKCPDKSGWHLTTVGKGKTLRDIPHGLQGIVASLNKKVSKKKRKFPK
jgi:hypothetical protein